MDFNEIYKSMSVGFGIGFVVMLMATLVFLPISYTMIRFIYHNWMMRIALGMLAGMGSILSVVVMFLFSPKTHFFGLIPIYQTSPSENTGYFAWLFKLLEFFTHPFLMIMDSAEDSVGYQKALEHLKAKEGAPRVDETFFQQTRRIGALRDLQSWRMEINNPALAEQAQALFT